MQLEIASRLLVINTSHHTPRLKADGRVELPNFASHSARNKMKLEIGDIGVLGWVEILWLISEGSDKS